MKTKTHIALILFISIVMPRMAFSQYTSDLCTNTSNASASSTFNANVAGNAFDDDWGDSHTSGTQWSSNNDGFPEWIQYDFGSGVTKTIKQYRFYTCYDDLYKPSTWKFQGSNNGSSWTDIHSVSSAVLSLSTWYTYNTSDFTNNTAYRYYRIYITASHTGNRFVDVEEIEMMELAATSPTVTTSAASSVANTSATLGGNVTSDGGASVTERGVVYSSTDNTPTIGEGGVTKDTNGSGTGSFSESIGSLSEGTTYYFQAYATNSEGTSYGGVENFTTLEAPTVATTAPSSVATTSATLGGNVTSDGGASVTERGVVYSSTDVTPTIGEAGVTKDTNGTGTGSFSESIGSLSQGTTYYVQAYATNSVGTTYGGVENFTTPVDIIFTNGANAGLDFQQTNPVSRPMSNWLCGQFSLQGAATGATLNSVVVSLSGSYDAGDLQSTPFQIYASNTNDFGTASALGSAVADPGSGSDVTFSSLSDAIPAAVRYYWVTADLSASATGDDTMNGTIDAEGDFNITNVSMNIGSAYGKLNAGDDVSLPVRLSEFSIRQQSQSVIIEWTTESEENHLGFILEKKKEPEAVWTTVASYMNDVSLTGQGNHSESRQYSVIDQAIQTGCTYLYRLIEVNSAGASAILDVLSVDVNTAPESTELAPPFPNPFNPSTKISYKLAQEASVSIRVFDLLGRLVCNIVTDELHAAGNYSKFWYGDDNRGSQLPSGLYVIQLEAGSRIRTQKVIFTK